jgi:hypothetical protein
MFHSQGVKRQSPRCRGLLLAPASVGASSGTIVADGEGNVDHALQFCKHPENLKNLMRIGARRAIMPGRA